MTSQLLIVFMSILIIGLVISPLTSEINLGLFKSTAWFLTDRGLLFEKFHFCVSKLFHKVKLQ